MKDETQTGYLRSKIAKIAGVTIETLRYYEKKGLIFPQRIENVYRVYSENIVERLRFIKYAKDAGFTLEEIRKTIQLQEYQLTAGDLSNIMADGIKAKIAKIDARIVGLTEIRALLLQIDRDLQQQLTCPGMGLLIKKE